MKKTSHTTKAVKDTRTSYQAGSRSVTVRRASVAPRHSTPVEVSVPEPVFQAMQHLATELDVPLGELYTTALTAYLASHGGVTETLNRLYATEPSELDPVLVSVQAALLISEPW